MQAASGIVDLVDDQRLGPVLELRNQAVECIAVVRHVQISVLLVLLRHGPGDLSENGNPAPSRTDHALH
jgi:hypothetical protein